MKPSDISGAEQALLLAIDSGHADRAPKAAFNLGVLREDRDDFEGAERAYQLAIDSGHHQHPLGSGFCQTINIKTCKYCQFQQQHGNAVHLTDTRLNLNEAIDRRKERLGVVYFGTAQKGSK